MPTRDLTAANEMRLFAGFLVQPFAAALLGFATFPLLEITRSALEGGGTTDDAMRAAISVGLGAGLVAVLVTVCAAFPLVVWLLRRGPLALKQVLWGGAILGNLPFLIILPLAAITSSHDADNSWLGFVRAIAFGAMFGVVGATIFWAISIRGTALERRERGLAQ